MNYTLQFFDFIVRYERGMYFDTWRRYDDGTYIYNDKNFRMKNKKRVNSAL